jgi:hypothetical protein
MSSTCATGGPSPGPAVAPKVQHVLDHAKEILARDEHLVLGHVQIELPVDAEATDLAEAVAVLVEELLDEELLGLLDLRRVARTQLRVDLQQGRLVLALRMLGELLELLLGDRVEDQRVRRVL